MLRKQRPATLIAGRSHRKNYIGAKFNNQNFVGSKLHKYFLVLS